MNILPIKNMRENGNFTTISNYVLEDTTLSKDARFLYCILTRYYNEDLEYSYPTRTHLALLLGVNEKTIDRYVRELLEANLIEIIGYRRVGKFSNNVYKIYYYDGQISIEDTITFINSPLDILEEKISDEVSIGESF